MRSRPTHSERAPAPSHSARRRAIWALPLSLGSVIALLVALSLAFTIQPAHGIGRAVDLGTAGSYVVLGGQTVTNTGPSVLGGDLGVSPGSAVTGFPPGVLNGTEHVADAQALAAQSDLTIAYNDAASQASDMSVAGDLGGRTLTPGVYTASSSILLTGPLTLDAGGDPDAVFIFQIGSALTTASASSVVLLNGANSCNVYWQVGSSATLGTDTRFIGTIMAFTSITLDTGARIQGRALARNGSVTLDSNVLSSESCEVGSTPAPTDGPGTPGPTDGPGTPGPTDGPGTPGPTDAPATPGPDDTPGTPVSIAPVVVPSGGTTSPGGSGSATTPGGGGSRTGAGKTSLAATGSSPWGPLALGGGAALVLGVGMVTAWMKRRPTRS